MEQYEFKQLSSQQTDINIRMDMLIDKLTCLRKIQRDQDIDDARHSNQTGFDDYFGSALAVAQLFTQCKIDAYFILMQKRIKAKRVIMSKVIVKVMMTILLIVVGMKS
jgi:hypothetical protein